MRSKCSYFQAILKTFVHFLLGWWLVNKCYGKKFHENLMIMTKSLTFNTAAHIQSLLELVLSSEIYLLIFLTCLP